MAEERKYLVQSHPPRFWAGQLADGRQILAGPMLPNISVYLFSEDGKFEQRELVPLNDPLKWDEGASRYIPRRGFMGELEAEVGDVLERHQVRESTVRIGAFFDDEQSIGIIDLPSDYAAFLEDPAHADSEEEAADFRESIAHWKSQGGFVLVWGAELWMDELGKLIAS